MTAIYRPAAAPSAAPASPEGRDGLQGLTVGRLPYRNVLPFHAAWQGPEPRWRIAPPRQLGIEAAGGKLDAACLASRDALALREDFRPLGRLGLACDGPVASVLLLSRHLPWDLDGRTIALTGESRTSRGLLRILLAGYWRVRQPHYVEGGPSADARLVIGDRALQEAEAARRAPGLHIVDLGAAWKAWTGLPFVYARWVVSRQVSPVAAEALENALDRSLAAFRLGTRSAEDHHYLQRFQYRLGAAAEAGLRRFSEELAHHDLLDHHRDQNRRRSAA